VTHEAGDRPLVYELTVLGRLGPMLRHALQPHKECRIQSCTIVRTGGAAHGDVVELVRFLASKGLQVEEVSRSPGRHDA
jgi:hypothetical protein